MIKEYEEIQAEQNIIYEFARLKLENATDSKTTRSEFIGKHASPHHVNIC